MFMIRKSKISLVPYDPIYFKSTLSIINHPEIMMLINGILPVTETEHEYWSKKAVFKRDSVIFAITTNSKSEHIGNCGLKNIDNRARKAELWIYIGVDYINKGYGIDSIQTLVEYGFNSLNLNRIYVYCIDYNKRAQRSFEKCGFINEGLFREDIYIGGQYRDTVRMAILRKDFEKRMI